LKRKKAQSRKQSLLWAFLANRKSAWNAANFHTPSRVFNIAKVRGMLPICRITRPL
jgi:hypothetical protein